MTIHAATPMKRTLGPESLEVGPVGLGCMGMSQHYGRADDNESIATIHRAIEMGTTMIDTAISYGLGHNKRLVGRALVGRWDTVTSCACHPPDQRAAVRVVSVE
jgi:aryl-alcohol dehydrogenase-like predicted oxidoreductase